MREYDEETVRWADAVIAAGGNSFGRGKGVGIWKMFPLKVIFPNIL